MKNPWLGFKHSEQMVHQLDEASVKEYNLTSKRDYQYLLNLAPEPRIGNISGNLLVLYSNPGATKENLYGVNPPYYELVVEKSIKNLNCDSLSTRLLVEKKLTNLSANFKRLLFIPFFVTHTCPVNQ